MSAFAALAAGAASAVLAAADAQAATPRVAPALRGDAARGQALYQVCTGCHSPDENDVGPKHRGVVGRRAGSVADYSYSSALRNSGLVWDPATLDRWLSNPQRLVPGAKMYFSVSDPQSRADIIAYLAQLK